MLSSRGGVAVTRWAHNPKFEGASPSPATAETASATGLSLCLVGASAVFVCGGNRHRSCVNPLLTGQEHLFYSAMVPYRDIERRRAYGRDWVKRNPEKAREGMRRWRKNHPEEHLAESHLYYERNKDRVRARIAAYKASYPEVRRTCAQNRRARSLAAAGSFTTRAWIALVASYGNRCAYCGAAGPLHADHRIPLARGGTNTISNIIPACPRCNNRKHVLTEEEFRARLAAEAVKLLPSPEAG